MKELNLESDKISIKLGDLSCVIRKPSMDEVFDISEKLSSLNAQEEKPSERELYKIQLAFFIDLGLDKEIASKLTPGAFEQLNKAIFDQKKD